MVSRLPSAIDDSRALKQLMTRDLSVSPLPFDDDPSIVTAVLPMSSDFLARPMPRSR